MMNGRPSVKGLGLGAVVESLRMCKTVQVQMVRFERSEI